MSESEAEKDIGDNPTPPFVTFALTKVSRVPPFVWEPAAGRGWMARELARCGHKVIATDLHPFVNPLVDVTSDVDFLTAIRQPVDGIVTHPPYSDGRAEAFVRHAIFDHNYPYAAFLLRPLFFESKRRMEMFRQRPPAEIYFFSERFNCMEEKFSQPGGMVVNVWVVWRSDWNGPPQVGWIDTKAARLRWQEETK